MAGVEGHESDDEFVFRGTVTRLKATTMAAVEAADETAVVHVDEVLQAPAAFAGMAGQDVTVRLRDPKSVSKSDSAMFTTFGLLFGDSVLVQEVEHTAVGRSPAKLAAKVAGQHDDRRRAAVSDRVARADLVVKGRVADVRQPKTVMLEARSADDAPVSEHDPAWMEAVVSVDETVKGSANGETVVLFPSSMDIAWAHVPKLHPGQEGVFMLHAAEQLPGLTPVAGSVLTVPQSLDVQPIEQLDQLKQLMPSQPPPRTARKPRKRKDGS